MGDEAKSNGSAPSLFAGAIAALEKVKEKKGDSEILVTDYFLAACKEVLPVVGSWTPWPISPPLDAQHSQAPMNCSGLHSRGK